MNVRKLVVFVDFAVNLAGAVDYCGMVPPAQQTADLGGRHLQLIHQQVHGDLARQGDGFGPASSQQFWGRYLVVIGGFIDDPPRVDGVASGIGGQVLENPGCQVQRYWNVHQVRIGYHPVETALQLSHVLLHPLGDELYDTLTYG